MLRIILLSLFAVFTALTATATEKRTALNPVFDEVNFKKIQATLKNFSPEQVAAIAAEAQKRQPELKNVSTNHIEHMLNDMANMQSAKELSELGKVASIQ